MESGEKKKSRRQGEGKEERTFALTPDPVSVLSCTLLCAPFSLCERLELANFGSRVWGSSYKGLYGEAPPEKDTLFRLRVYEQVGISLVEVYERVGKSVVSVCKKAQKG